MITDSASVDWSHNWQRIVSHGVEYSEDDDDRYRFISDIVVCPRFHQFTPTSRGKYSKRRNYNYLVSLFH